MYTSLALGLLLPHEPFEFENVLKIFSFGLVSVVKMASDQYRRVALDENENAVSHRNTSLQCNPMIVLIMLFIVTVSFAFGFGIGGNWSSGSKIQSLKNEVVPGPNGLLDPQSFLPDSQYILDA